MSTDPVDKALLSKIVHPHGYINHVLHQLLHRSTIGLRRDVVDFYYFTAATLAHLLRGSSSDPHVAGTPAPSRELGHQTLQ